MNSGNLPPILQRLNTGKEIRLNLLPPKPPEPLLQRVLKPIGIAGAILCMLLVIASLALPVLNFQLKRKSQQIEDEIAALQRKEGLAVLVAEISSLQSKLLQTQASFSGKSRWSRRVAEITRAVPSGTWLDGITVVTHPENKAGRILLLGGAQTQDLLVNFLKNIEEKKWISKVTLKGSQQQEASTPQGPVRYVSFEIMVESAPE